MSFVINANANIPIVNNPKLGFKLLNIYTGDRLEKENMYEKLGQVYVFCISRSIGKTVVFVKGKPCEVKTAHIRLILFGAAALLTIPFTMLGLLLVPF